ncbi:MAG: hypothetical protein IPH16_07860 [Haliscomenobacter sp.]|nr:hypothetical protein [Haliscomenobacter sp.]MBK7475862.1 hypothetical protein [Haliscomenobacter sp.]MBK8880547.1 hypothetical protein [Haliscomenobacter sp.]
MSQHLNCPNCGQLIEAEHINIENMAAVCSACNHVFNFAELVQPSTPQIRADGVQLELPKGFEVRRGMDELLIDVKWRNTRGGKGFFTVFALFWNLFLIPFVVMAISSGELKILLFLSLHLIVGISFLIYTLGLWLNTTLITVSRKGIDVRHQPIPIPFNPKRQLIASDIQQLYVEEYVPSKTNGRPDITYAVRYKTHKGEDERLVKGFRSANQALYIEREVEKFLGIDDKPV